MAKVGTFRRQKKELELGRKGYKLHITDFSTTFFNTPLYYITNKFRLLILKYSFAIDNHIMNLYSIPTIIELFEMFCYCAIELDTIYTFQLSKVNQSIAVIKLKGGSDLPECSYSIIHVMNVTKYVFDENWSSQVLQITYKLMDVLIKSICQS